jgi:TonB family protein
MGEANSMNSRAIAFFAAFIAIFCSSPLIAQTALNPSQISQIVNGPCAETRQIAQTQMAQLGVGWDKLGPKVEEDLPKDLTVAEVEALLAKTRENIRLYYDDFAGKVDDYRVCLYINKLSFSSANAKSSTLAEPVAGADAVDDDLVKFSQFWSVRKIGNCNAILNHRAFRLDASGNKSDFTLPDFDMPVVAFEWTGGCNANGLIEGPGHLKIYESEGNGPRSTLSLSDRAFTAKNGMPDGVGQIGFYNYEPDFDHPGKYIYTVIKDDFTTPREIMTEYYRDGCLIKTGFKEICDPAVGAALQARYMTDKSVVKPAINQRRAYEKRIEDLFEATAQALAASPPPPPHTPAAMAIAPKLLTNIGAMMDYPLEALRNGWQGRVAFSVSVSPIGSPVDCRITNGSGYPVLDNATCDVLRRATFTPAFDGSGTPVNGTYNGAVRWTLPE